MSSGLRILYLEDNPVDRELVELTLASSGINHQAVHAVTKTEFLAALEGEGIDLILSDSSLPGFDGEQALALARSRRPDVPFLFYSGNLDPERTARWSSAGVNGIILKGDLPSLVASILAAVNIKRSD